MERPQEYEITGEIAPEVLTARLLQLPEEIRAQEAVCQELEMRFRQADLDLEREKAKIHMDARANGENSADAKMIAIRDSEEWQARFLEAESAYKAAIIILNKKEREFVGLRKVASIRSDEMRMSGRGN